MRFGSRIAILVLAIFGVLVTACTRPPWPVPVSEHRDVAGELKRLGLELPLTDPASCREIARQEFLRDPDRCPQLETLMNFLDRHAARMTPPGGPAFEIDDDLWLLMRALGSAKALRTEPFPKNAATLPEDVRELDTWRAVDSRDETPPQGRLPVAFLYRGFWWSFWQKEAPAPPPPGSGVDPRAKTPFDTLIVFPEFPERIPTGR